MIANYAMPVEKTRGRIYNEKEHSYRSPYHRDRDRIIHSTAFRRLEYKTQVFLNHEGDQYRTRLTHTFEVSQISRTIAHALHLNEDLTEVAALAHDLGHTPFGHAGETALNKLMKDHGGFNHNTHGLRVVDELELRYFDFPGLNLSYEVRESFLRHNAVTNYPGIDVSEGALLEVQATVIADEIAYDNHDIDDGLSSGILCEEELMSGVRLWKKAMELCGASIWKCPPVLRRAEGVRHLINFLVTDLIDESRRQIKRYKLNSLESVRELQKNVITLSQEVFEMKEELELFLREKLYNHYSVLRMNRKAKNFLEDMFNLYVENKSLLSPDWQLRIESNGLHRTVCDYIAGMTDRFSEEEYRKLFFPFTKT